MSQRTSFSVLEHVPSQLNQGDSLRAKDERVYRDPGRGGSGDAQAQDSWQPQRDVALLQASQRHFSKKSLHAAEQERADVARARQRWMREQGMFDPAHLVFVDETAANTKMVRLSGRCPRGERLIGRVPQGHWKTIT